MAEHNRLVNRIGNLTLLSGRLNQAIRNAAYVDKTASYRTSELVLTNSLPDEYPQWDAGSIAARQERLAEEAGQIWRFEE